MCVTGNVKVQLIMAKNIHTAWRHIMAQALTWHKTEGKIPYLL